MTVAPRRQWVLATMTLGGMLLVFPWVVLAISRGVSGAAEVGVAVAGLGSLLLGAAIGPPLGLLWSSLRRPPESDELRPRRQHGVSAWFEPADLTAYSHRHGVRVAPVTDNAASLPKWHQRRYRNLLQFGGRSARVLSPYWRRVSWLAPLWAAAAIVVLVSAAILRTEVAIPLALTGAGALVLLAGGIWWVRSETNTEATTGATADA